STTVSTSGSRGVGRDSLGWKLKKQLKDFAMHDQVNILDLVKSLRDDTTGLIRDEVALAKTEIGEKVATASRNVGYLAVGALVAYAGVIFLLVAVSFILRAMFLAGDVSEPIPNLLSFLIFGVT